MDTPTAIRQLRAKTGDSQQAFATRLGISIRGLANYEKDREPNQVALVQLMKVAGQFGEPILADLFKAEASRKLGHDVAHFTDERPGFRPGEAAEVDILLTVLRTPAHKPLMDKWRKITSEIRQRLAEDESARARSHGLSVAIRRLALNGETDQSIARKLKQSIGRVQLDAAHAREMKRLADGQGARSERHDH